MGEIVLDWNKFPQGLSGITRIIITEIVSNSAPSQSWEKARSTLGIGIYITVGIAKRLHYKTDMEF